MRPVADCTRTSINAPVTKQYPHVKYASTGISPFERMEMRKEMRWKLGPDDSMSFTCIHHGQAAYHLLDLLSIVRNHSEAAWTGSSGQMQVRMLTIVLQGIIRIAELPSTVRSLLLEVVRGIYNNDGAVGNRRKRLGV